MADAEDTSPDAPANPAARAALTAVFERLGGADGMEAWARAHPADFYTKLYPKLLPLDVTVAADEDLAELLAAARRRVQP